MTSLPLPLPLPGALPPLPWPGALPAVSPTLARTLLLALLLHVWLVLLLGNAPGGTAPPGQGVGGAINVTLRGPEAPGVAEVAPTPLPSGPAGAAELPRWGGTVREAAPATPEVPGAARLGEWAATAPPAPAAQFAPITPPEPVAPLATSPPAAVGVTSLPAADALLPEPLPAAAAPAPPPPPKAAPAPAERTLATPLPAAPPPTPALAVPAAAAPLPLALPAVDTRLAEPLAALPAPPPPALPTPAPIAAPAALPEPELPRLSRPVPAATAPVASLPSAARPLPAVAPPLPMRQALPALGPSPALPAAIGPDGRPDAGSQVGQDVATPPAAAASTPPRLNLQLARPRGGELSRFSAPGVLPLLPRPPDLPDKLADDIAKSAKKDCRTAHQGAGLLAVVPLAAEALRKDSACKW